MTHAIFNECPESQDRALKVLEKLGYTYVSRSDAEAKRGSRNRVLFEDELHKFLNTKRFSFGSKKSFFTRFCRQGLAGARYSHYIGAFAL